MIPETPTIHRYVPGKLRAWEAVYWLNRSFEAVLLSLERLERVGMFRMECLIEWKIRLEHHPGRGQRGVGREPTRS